MQTGVLYKFQENNKINGTLFYCFEYFAYLEKHSLINFYIIGVNQKDLVAIKKIFSEKYDINEALMSKIIPIKVTDIYKLNLSKTLILDIKTFYGSKEFLTNQVHCFSNESHPMFRYKNEREVIYYGSYDYQDYDIRCILKLNFGIFKKSGFKKKAGVFISSPEHQLIKEKKHIYEKLYSGKRILLKDSSVARGDLFSLINTVHYVHTGLDTNNRIIPEGLFYEKEVAIEEMCEVVDSTSIRLSDIKLNGLGKYWVDGDDVMVRGIIGSE